MSATQTDFHFYTRIFFLSWIVYFKGTNLLSNECALQLTVTANAKLTQKGLKTLGDFSKRQGLFKGRKCRGMGNSERRERWLVMV